VLEEDSACSFSVHSIQAAQMIHDKSRLWYFAQGWGEEEIQRLTEMGVRRFVVDNQADLDSLTHYVDGHDIMISLLLRMRLKEHTVQTGKHYVFGFYTRSINELLPRLKKNKHITELGIHFHRKTQNISEWSLKEELEQSIETWDCIDVVNIGGGLPSIYKNFRAETIPNILQKISTLQSWLKEKGKRMIIEPGRYIAAPSVTLEANIVAIYDRNIVLDCSIFNSAMDTFIAHHRLLIQGELESGTAYTIKGCTPDSLDIFRYRAFLEEPRVGDTFRFLNAGAYNFSTEFCMLPKVQTVIR